MKKCLKDEKASLCRLKFNYSCCCRGLKCDQICIALSQTFGHTERCNMVQTNVLKV
jgi:hypothetical protein